MNRERSEKDFTRSWNFLRNKRLSNDHIHRNKIKTNEYFRTWLMFDERVFLIDVTLVETLITPSYIGVKAL
jgi:hypothetical protein